MKKQNFVVQIVNSCINNVFINNQFYIWGWVAGAVGDYQNPSEPSL